MNCYYTSGRFPAIGSRAFSAALCHVLSCNKPDLHRAGAGLGYFHKATDPASGYAQVPAAFLCDGGALAAAARLQIPLFSIGRYFTGIVVLLLHPPDFCAAVRLLCCTGAGTKRRSATSAVDAADVYSGLPAASGRTDQRWASAGLPLPDWSNERRRGSSGEFIY